MWKKATLATKKHSIVTFFLRRLRVGLSELSVENELSSRQDWFNAEDGETDAELAEHHAISHKN